MRCRTTILHAIDCMWLPSGYRIWSGESNPGSFNNVGLWGWWWTSTEAGNNSPSRQLYLSEPGVKRFFDERSNGFSVRCLRKLTSKISLKLKVETL